MMILNLLKSTFQANAAPNSPKAIMMERNRLKIFEAVHARLDESGRSQANALRGVTIS
jgi:hypothetical protein